ncbi:PucR family transcriptional regulator [Goodfellowiella coeruleoviolacea]|uniref:DNA-binding transcriptional regulator, PucR family n=1 Tax=Goodfellowiella coeruleoviolacea TaxID=334858 RepID=A0AAE3GHI0_9PSEU|nr:helix-turn-helix domain-containing protein [Goodfellowiella coeruleoviolacea]MCP2168346.1 DNA-binding transcriptional regulator, PucR family [Goodfellowiella coeruleoviolacea]
MVALGRLVDVLTSLGGQLVCAPRGRDVQLRGVALHDPVERPSAAPDDVLLGLGTGTPSAAARLVARTAAAAVVLHGHPPVDERVLAAARRSGAAVLLIDPAVPWSQLANAAQTLVLGDPRHGSATEAGGDLFALADAIAAVVDGPVTIEDQQSRVLAYSYRQQDVDPVRVQTILGRRVPEEARRALDDYGVFDHLARSAEPLLVPKLTDSLGCRLVAAVRAGRELLGSVWVEIDEADGAELARRSAALLDGARAAALHLLRARARADLERQAEADLVIGLLDDATSAPAALARLGLPSTELRVIALQAHVGEGEHGAALLAFERATAGFGWSRPGRSALFGNVLYTVLPCGEEPDQARAWVRTLARELPAGATVRAGIGGCADANQLPISRQEADECLALHTADGGDPLVYDEAWARVLLQRLADAADAGRLPSRGPVADLLRHDAHHGTQYAATLDAWLAAQGDVRTAARRLAVHPNTLRYRLARLSEVTPVRLDDPAQRLAMAVALAVAARRGQVPSAPADQDQRPAQ